MFQHRIWMIDLAREQHVSQNVLFQYADLAQQSGYTAIGLYFEHRFAYPSTPWTHGQGCLYPGHVQALLSEYPSIDVIPFLNVFSHMEGMLYTEEGSAMREDRWKGLQGCPCNQEFQALCRQWIDDICDSFPSQIIHIGGDETSQLANCPLCKERAATAEDPKAFVYAMHYRPLIEYVIQKGRTPAIWGDMMLSHPSLLIELPKETIIFDWQYFKGNAESSKQFKAHGFQTIGCPTLHVYNAAWMHTEASEQNVNDVIRDSHELELSGVCLTTWESCLMASYDSILPAVKWAGERFKGSEAKPLINAFSEPTWAKMMGEDLEKLGGIFSYSEHRSYAKSLLLMQSNPFLLYSQFGKELCGESGAKAIAIANESMQYAFNEAERNASAFLRSVVEFCLLASKCHAEYKAKKPEAAVAAIAPTLYLFDTLEKLAKQNHARIGGSLADIERSRIAKRHVETVIRRIRDYGNGELGYLPAFDVITNPRFVPHDQGCWWLVNNWANE